MFFGAGCRNRPESPVFGLGAGSASGRSGAAGGTSNSSSSCSAKGDPPADNGKAFGPDVPLGLRQVPVLQPRQRQLLGTEPVERVGGDVEVWLALPGVDARRHHGGGVGAALFENMCEVSGAVVGAGVSRRRSGHGPAGPPPPVARHGASRERGWRRGSRVPGAGRPVGGS